MKKLKFLLPLFAAAGLVLTGAATAQAGTGPHNIPGGPIKGTQVTSCVMADTTATWNGDGTVTASTSGPNCTAQLSSWVITKGHPQKLLDRITVHVTEQSQTFGVETPKCGPYQIDLRTEKLPNGKFLTGGIAKGNTEGDCAPPPPPEPSAIYKVTCHGFDVHLKNYPKGTVVEVAIDHTAATATKLGKGGKFDFSIQWDSKKDHFYELTVTYPKWIENPKNWSISGPVKACFVATPVPPKQVDKPKCDSDGKTATTKDDCLAFTGATPFTTYALGGGLLSLLLGTPLMFVRKKDALIES